MRSAGEVIKEARRRARLSQRDLAEIAGVAQPNIAAYEADRRVPSLAMLQRLAGACDHRTHPTWWADMGQGELAAVGLGDLLALEGYWTDADRSALACLEAAQLMQGEVAPGLRPYEACDLTR